MSDDPHAELRNEVVYAHIRRNVLQDVYAHAAQELEQATIHHSAKFTELMRAEENTCHKLIKSGRHPIYCQGVRNHEGACWGR